MHYNLDWLIKRFDAGETLKYIFFWGHSNKDNDAVGKFVFSQWYPSRFVVDNAEYKTAEHWMMAQKALLFDDSEVFNKILETDHPASVKALGRQIKNFDQRMWDENKFEIVRAGSIHKFSQEKKLAEFLIGTGDRVLVEASPTDNIWGIGLSENAKMIENPHTWQGQNLLGFALMEARDLLRK